LIRSELGRLGDPSTNRQADEGESLDTQKRTLEGYAMMLDLRIDRVFVERGVSGSKPLGERPEGAALLCVLQQGDVVITPKLDRMFRSARDGLAVAWWSASLSSSAGQPHRPQPPACRA